MCVRACIYVRVCMCICACVYVRVHFFNELTQSEGFKCCFLAISPLRFTCQDPTVGIHISGELSQDFQLRVPICRQPSLPPKPALLKYLSPSLHLSNLLRSEATFTLVPFLTHTLSSPKCYWLFFQNISRISLMPTLWSTCHSHPDHDRSFSGWSDSPRFVPQRKS